MGSNPVSDTRSCGFGQIPEPDFDEIVLKSELYSDVENDAVSPLQGFSVSLCLGNLSSLSPSHSDRELHPAKTSPVPSLIPVMEPGRFIHLCGLETVLSRQCPGREQGQLSFQGNWSNDPKQRFSISVTNTIVGVVWLRRDAE